MGVVHQTEYSNLRAYKTDTGDEITARKNRSIAFWRGPYRNQNDLLCELRDEATFWALAISCSSFLTLKKETDLVARALEEEIAAAQEYRSVENYPPNQSEDTLKIEYYTQDNISIIKGGDGYSCSMSPQGVAILFPSLERSLFLGTVDLTEAAFRAAVYCMSASEIGERQTRKFSRQMFNSSAFALASKIKESENATKKALLN